jgi:hypothetical protein
MPYDYDPNEHGEGDYEYPRDSKIDEAKEVLLRDLFEKRASEVFYSRQIEILFERRFFHWITAKALNELVQEQSVSGEFRDLGSIKLKLYWSKKHRYPRRQSQEIANLVLRSSEQPFTRAIGRHGEMMFDAALPTGGFLPRGRNVNAYGGNRWTESGHDLDRVFEKDAVLYGVEIKNTLAYIEREELQVKIRMCKHLGLTPLFIMRMAPKSYIDMVRLAGGFSLIFEWQLYPHGYAERAKQVRERLGLKVDCPEAIQAGTVARLVNWHEKQISGR